MVHHFEKVKASKDYFGKCLFPEIVKKAKNSLAYSQQHSPLSKKSPDFRLSFSTLGRIRTLNPRSRNPIFYPVELRVRNLFLSF